MESLDETLVYKEVKHYKKAEGRRPELFHITEEVRDCYGLQSPTNKRFKIAVGELKEASGARVDEIAEAIMMSHGYVSDLLRGKNNPDKAILERLAFFFNLPPEHFLEYRLMKLIRLLKKEPVMIDVFSDILTGDYENGGNGSHSPGQLSLWLEDIKYT
jgi:transcriptional regulator with XRE-family HTH domain